MIQKKSQFKYENAILIICNDYKYPIVAGTILHMYCNSIYGVGFVVNFIALTESLNKICGYGIEICV